MFKSVLGFFGKIQTKIPPDNGAELAEALERLGFFADLGTDEAASVKLAMQSNAIHFMDHRLRVYMADAEDLAEEGVGAWLREISGALHSRGVMIGDIKEETDGNYYYVTVNGRKFTIYTHAETVKNNNLYTWGYAFSRTLMLANQLLSEAGSKEQFYGYAGTGNDGFAYLLTAEQADAILRLVGYKPEEQFVIMNDKPPLFGTILHQ
jgi:hypothetical protein